MKKILTRIAPILLLLATPAAAQTSNQPLPSVDLPAPLARVLRDYEKAWRARDAAELAELFTEDGFVLSSGKMPVRGRAAIREAYAKGGGPLTLRALSWSTDGNLGYIIGGYRGSADGPDEGKFTLVLRRVNERWLIAADMDNGNNPPRRAAPPQ